MKFLVSLSHPSVRDITVDVNTEPHHTAPAGSGAISGVDYTPLAIPPAIYSVTFPDGSTDDMTIRVPTDNDDVDELDSETFRVVLSNPQPEPPDPLPPNPAAADPYAQIDGGQATGRILDNDGPPAAVDHRRLRPRRRARRHRGQPRQLHRESQPPHQPPDVTVDLTTEDDPAPDAHPATAGTCESSPTGDYEEITSPLTLDFAVDPNTGATAAPSLDADPPTRYVAVQSCDDTVFEYNETFLARIRSDQATDDDPLVIMGTDTAIGTIRNVDSLSVTVDSAEVDEDDPAGEMVFTVTHNGASDVPILVFLYTADATDPGTHPHPALAGIDYTPIDQASPATVNFGPGGESAQSAEVAVPIIDDALHEFNETFWLHYQYRAPGTAGVRSPATGTILNDDDPPILSITDPADGDNNAEAEEGSDVTFAVTLDPAAGRDVTVGYQTVDRLGGTDVADGGTSCTTDGVDYLHNDDELLTGIGRLTFEVNPDTGSTHPGQISQNIDVTTCRDDIAESDEEFGIELRDPDLDETDETDEKASLSTTNAAATGTIIDDSCVEVTGEEEDPDPPEITLNFPNSDTDDEGNRRVSESLLFEYTVTLGTPFCDPQALEVDLLEGTARPTTGLSSLSAGTFFSFDYIANRQPVSFEAKKAEASGSVDIFDDRLDELDETFTIEFHWPELMRRSLDRCRAHQRFRTSSSTTTLPTSPSKRSPTRRAPSSCSRSASELLTGLDIKIIYKTVARAHRCRRRSSATRRHPLTTRR